MSRHADVTIPWGDDEYTFRLGLKQLRALQEVCDAGPPFIAARLRANQWRVDDVRETIRLGLIGAKIDQNKVLTLMGRFVDSVPLADNVLIAWTIINAAIYGTDEEPVGKKVEGEPIEATSSPEAKSPLQDSMAAVL